jgi:hypothetical protein
MKHTKRALLVATALIGLGAAAPALAKETARLALFPAHPRVGRLTTVQLRPYLYLGGTDLRPRLVDAAHKWNVSAFSTRTGQSIPLRLHRNARNPYVWSAKLRFGSPGWWTVYRGLFEPPLDVLVRPRGHPSIWEKLERPFHTPTVPYGDPCPTTGRGSKGDLSRISPAYTGTTWGEGPVYPGGLDRGFGRPTLLYEDPISPSSGFYGSQWFGNKVLWIFDPLYAGPILIRGLQVDGGNELRFNNGNVPPLAIKTRSGANRDLPSYTRVRAAGCYAYQIDGTTFSSTIVFDAKPSA